jgi:hypothetical protein
MVEELRWPLELTVDCGFGRGTVLAATTQVVVASLALLPGCGGVVSCCVRCLRVVAFSSACDVQLILLLI